MSIVQQLWDLQEIDLDHDGKQQRLQAILAQLGETPALRAARAAVHQIQTELPKLEALRRNLEMETQSLEAKVAAVEERLYSGRVTHPKELTDLQKDAAALRKQRTVLDEKSLTAILAIEEKQAALTLAQLTLNELEKTWTNLQHDLQTERTHIETQLTELTRRRAALCPQISGNILTQYETLRREKHGIAVAAIADGFCQVCGVEVPEHKLAQMLLDDILVFCTNCDRILIEQE
jgi:hypothetical protein